MVFVEWRYSPFVQSTPEGENGKQAIEVPVYIGDFSCRDFRWNSLLLINAK